MTNNNSKNSGFYTQNTLVCNWKFFEASLFSFGILCILVKIGGIL